MLTPQNMWFFIGGIVLFVGVMFTFAAPTVASEPPLFIGIGLAVTAIGGALLYKALARRKLEEALRRSGLPAEATVIEVSPSGVEINRTELWAVRYEYRDGFGKTHRDRRLVYPEEASHWPVGRKVPVRYDSRKPKLHVLLEPGP